jgi:hypothetical protein
LKAENGIPELGGGKRAGKDGERLVTGTNLDMRKKFWCSIAQ